MELIEVVQGDNDPIVRTYAARALGVIQTPSTVSGLIHALDDNEPGVRMTSVEALKIINDPGATSGLIHALEDKDVKIRLTAIEALGHKKDTSTVRHLLSILLDKDEFAGAAAARSLKQINDKRALSGFLQAIQIPDGSVHPSSGYHGAVTEALVAMADDSTIDSLIGFLAGKDRYNGQYIAQVLYQIASPKALKAINDWKKEQDKERIWNVLRPPQEGR